MAVTIHTSAVDGNAYDVGGLQMDSVLRWIGTITGPTSYVAGGVDLPLPVGATVLSIQSGTVKDKYVKKTATLKALFMVASTDVEVAGAANLDTTVIPVVVYFRKA